MQEEGSEQPWIKRIRWSHTGHVSDDERINAVASLWVEGTLRSLEFADQLRDGVFGAKRGSELPAAELGDFAKAARIASEWLALNGAVDFALHHGFQTADERQTALDLLSRELSKTVSIDNPPPTRSIARWWQRLHESAAEATADDRRIDDLIAEWTNGLSSTSQFTRDLVRNQIELEKRKPPAPSASSGEDVSLWAHCIRCATRSMMARTAADYAESQGWRTPEQRQLAMKLLDDALATPVPARRGGRGLT